MIFESNMSLLYSDTQVPDVFITEYMPSMQCEYVKIYVYCLFLNNHKKQASAEDISKKLDIALNIVKDAFTYMESIGLVSRTDKGMTIVDLKEKEIRRLYRPKSTSTPEEAALSSDRSKKRSKFISEINNAFFQGVMSPSWYTDIDNWFDKYKFEEDVMYALFKHCYDHKGLSKQYIAKVADNWCSKNIRNGFDLDKYSMEHQKIKDIDVKIMKKFRKYGQLTEYEEGYVEKWVAEYGYDFDIIEIALKKTTNIMNPSFEYINKIITDWHENGLKTKDQVITFDKQRAKPDQSKPVKAKENAVPQKGNFKQRQYSDEFFEKLYKDV